MTDRKKKPRRGLFSKKSMAADGHPAAIPDEEKRSLEAAASRISEHCKKSGGYCLGCPIAKRTQMCTITPDKWTAGGQKGGRQ